jgi:hypothetical protein
MSTDFQSLSIDQQYNLLKKAVEVIHNKDSKYKDDPSFEFKEDDNVNIIGVRGFDGAKAISNDFNKFNDRIFVVSNSNGTKIVKSFKASTDKGVASSKSTLIVGQHPYELGLHKRAKTELSIRELKDGYDPNCRYRALNPGPVGVRTQFDSNEDNVIVENENTIHIEYGINIHYGGGSDSVGKNSLGCQIIHGWENYKDFIRCLEKDSTIKGTKNNELEPKPATDGTRYVTYTLLTGTEFEEIIKGGASGSLCFPIPFDGSLSVNAKGLEACYKHIEKDFPGGYYPIGGNTVWHGGVHLRSSDGKPMGFYSMLNGKIIAARLASTEDGSQGVFGSHNFIITEHMHKENKFYCLYIHLHFLTSDVDKEFLSNLPWLNHNSTSNVEAWKVASSSLNIRSKSSADASKVLESGLPKGTVVKILSNPTGTADGWQYVEALGKKGFVSAKYLEKSTSTTTTQAFDQATFDKCISGKIVKLDIPIKSGDLLWKSGFYGSKSWLGNYQANLLHWEIFSEAKLFLEDTSKEPEFSPQISGAEPWVANAKLLVQGAAASTNQSSIDKTISIAVNKCSHSNAPASELAKIQWALKINGVSSVLGEKGHKIDFKIKSEHAGKTLVFHPFMNSPADSVCASVHVAANKPIEWKYAEDSNDDYIVDAKEIRKLFSQELADGVITTEELINFYKNDPDGKATQLRSYACKFTSEWGVPDIQSALDKIQGRGWFTADADDFLPYNWWQDAVSAGVGIPKKSNVWHYHPVKLLEKISSLSSASTASSDMNIDWAFIGKMEGTKTDMYVPKKDGVVIGNSGPTIASGFDLGQINADGLKAYRFSSDIEKKLLPYVGLQSAAAATFVDKHPLSLSAENISEIDKTVKSSYAKKCETYYNASVSTGKLKFNELAKETQTAFASAYFQYGSCPTLRSKLIAENFTDAAHEILFFTTRTTTVKHKKTGAETQLMAFMERRCQEARYFHKGICDPAVKTQINSMIINREAEWEAAHGENKWW